MNNFKRTILMAAGFAMVFASSACAPTIRTITAETWDHRKAEHGVMYMSYWQGKAGMFGGKGDMMISKCHIAKDNSLACKNQEEAQNALNVKGRGKGEAKE